MVLRYLKDKLVCRIWGKSRNSRKRWNDDFDVHDDFDDSVQLVAQGGCR